MIKKLMLMLISGVLFLPAGTLVPAEAQPASASEIEYVGNDYVEVSVSQDTGRFSIQTKQGHPLRMDDEGDLLFLDEQPDTSFTTFRIDGADYTFGADYGYLGLDSGFSDRPATQGLSNRSVWRIDGMEVVQTITLVDDVKNPNIGNVKIAYEVTNTTAQSVSVGSRILLDTMLGAEDSSPIALSGSDQYIRTETDLNGSNVPAYWRAVDDPLSPQVMTYGFLRGWDNRIPDRMVVAHWEGLSATTWDYAVQDIDFTTDQNRYGSRDSAVALYWNPATLRAGQTMQFETYYGLGSFFTSEPEARYGVQFLAPKELRVNEEQDSYAPDHFEIMVTIDNTRADARVIQNAVVELGLPLELELAEGEMREKRIDLLRIGEVTTLSWQVKAIPQQTYKAARYWVGVRQSGGRQTTHADYVIMPALSGAAPQLQLLDVLPRKKFIEAGDRWIRMKGQGFSALVNNWDADLALVREHDGRRFPLVDYEVLDDGLMQAELNELWLEERPEAGDYTLQLDAGEYGRFDRQIELTMDTEYQSRSYGLLAIVKRSTSYEMVPIDKEQALAQVSGEVLLTIRGDIRELRSGGASVFEAAPGTTINSVIRFDGDETVRGRFGGDQLLRIEKNDGTLEIRGTGVLSVPYFPFVSGPFAIELEDGKHYALDARGEQSPVRVQWELVDYLNEVATMSYFPVTIKNAVVGDKSVSFGGRLSMNFGALQDDGDDDFPLKLNIDLEEARFGLNDNRNFDFLGLRAEGEVGMPKDLLPGMDFGAEGRLLVDTLDQIYELEADVNFKVIETGGLFTIRFLNNSIPILDNFEFYVGGKPGIPLIPGYTVGYITKGGGGFNDLYDTLAGNFNVLPPLKLVVIGGMSIGNILFADDMRLEASLRGILFESSISVLEIPIFEKAYGRYLIEDSLRNSGIEAKIGAEISVFDVIEGDASATISYSSDNTGIMGPVTMSGGGNVSLIVPRNILFVGGKKIADVRGYISTGGVSATARIINIPINMRYDWGDSRPRLASLSSMPMMEAAGLSTEPILENGELAGTMLYGSNIKRVSSMANWTNQAKGQVMLLSSALPSTLDIPVGEQDFALFEFAYSGERPDVEMTTPGGQPYELIEDENMLIQHISAEESKSGLAEQYIYVSVTDPQPGTWKVATSKPLDDGRLLDVKELPVLDQLTVEQTGSHVLKVQWHADHVDEDMNVALYLSEDGDTDSGQLLLHALPTSGSTTVTLPETLASGNYYIRATVVDKDMLEADRYSDTSFVIDNPYELPAPDQVVIEPVGNGLIRAQWDFDGEADGFVLQALDADGRPLPNIGAVQVEGGRREAGIGGTYHDQGTGEQFGLVPGDTYRMEVTAYQEVDGLNVYGRAAVSAPLYVPEPAPAKAQLTVRIDGVEAGRMVDAQGDRIYVVHEPAVDVALQADQTVESEVRVNERHAADRSGDEWQQAVELTEGLNRIDVVSVNEQGDVTISGVQVRLDTAAPDLKIESPGTSVLSSGDELVTVSGIAEPGSVVTVDGATVESDLDGRFTADVSIAGYLSRYIEVTAEDAAGNRSVYAFQAVNDSVGSLQFAELRERSATLEEGEADEAQEGVDLVLQVGETAELELVAIDDRGEAYVLDSNLVSWDLLLGEQYGELSNGKISVNHPGKLVAHAAYRIAGDYALQDAFVVHIQPGDGQGEIADYEDWYDEDWKDNYPRNPVDLPIWIPTSPDGEPAEDMDVMLREALRSIIEAEQGTVFLDYLALQDGEARDIAVGDRAALKVFAQRWDLEGAGVGIGTVTNEEPYLAGESRRLIGSIYEVKTNKPVRFEQPPELLIRFGLEDVADYEKLGIYWYNERKLRWEYIGGEVNPLYGTVVAELPHFSKYALLYDEQMTRFADMRGRWSTDAVYRLSSVGILEGWQQSGRWVFAPGQSIRRQEFVKMIVGMEELPPSGSTELQPGFADRDRVSTWALPYMIRAVDAGWVAGSDAGEMLYLNPLQEITRAEAVVMLARVLDDAAPPSDSGAGAVAAFRDAQEIPPWAIEAVAMLSREGIVGGYPDGTFRPGAMITREEAAVLLRNVMDWTYLNEG
ncbi:S-layer homology domain-containing protein [Paenibacillus sp. IB182496]|uniref:S-layer homology domain-containing protein n=1 Tax=Paenibacillus sabuli TaxID=2772509 RepID=A0A927BYC3_9BACL|nr:S-layer homology domain-containing protein [Paenibacillus sabuli]MBD2847870.1 S-layer homology domain-containing protein [Paenibacillus sabuli]